MMLHRQKNRSLRRGNSLDYNVDVSKIFKKMLYKKIEENLLYTDFIIGQYELIQKGESELDEKEQKYVIEMICKFIDCLPKVEERLKKGGL